MIEQGTHYRDKTFDFYRRLYGKLFSTDIDVVEFYNREPIDIREYKSRRSGWKNGMNASVIVQARLAERADLPYFVIEHDDDWQKADIYKISIDGKTYRIEDHKETTLQKYLIWLYQIHGLKRPRQLPTRFEPITRSRVILNLWDELSQDEKSTLLQDLIGKTKA